MELMEAAMPVPARLASNGGQPWGYDGISWEIANNIAGFVSQFDYFYFIDLQYMIYIYMIYIYIYIYINMSKNGV